MKMLSKEDYEVLKFIIQRGRQKYPVVSNNIYMKHIQSGYLEAKVGGYSYIGKCDIYNFSITFKGLWMVFLYEEKALDGQKT